MEGMVLSEPQITRIARITRIRGLSYQISCCKYGDLVLSEPQITRIARIQSLCKKVRIMQRTYPCLW